MFVVLLCRRHTITKYQQAYKTFICRATQHKSNFYDWSLISLVFFTTLILQQQKKFALTLHKILDIQIAKINEQLTNENPYSLRSHDFCNINQIFCFKKRSFISFKNEKLLFSAIISKSKTQPILHKSGFKSYLDSSKVYP